MLLACLISLLLIVAWPAAADTQARPVDPETSYRLGLRYLQGSGVPRSEEEAERFLRRAAERHHPGAEAELAFLMADPVETTRWLEDAASHGLAEAQYYLGLAYTLGEGVEPDAVRAADLFRRAAEGGYAPALYDLALAYLDGAGVPRSVGDACGLLLSADRLGVEHASVAVTENCSKLSEAQRKRAGEVARRFNR
mgnify:CR=1 FL=1